MESVAACTLRTKDEGEDLESSHDKTYGNYILRRPSERQDRALNQQPRSHEESLASKTGAGGYNIRRPSAVKYQYPSWLDRQSPSDKNSRARETSTGSEHSKPCDDYILHEPSERQYSSLDQQNRSEEGSHARGTSIVSEHSELDDYVLHGPSEHQYPSSDQQSTSRDGSHAIEISTTGLNTENGWVFVDSNEAQQIQMRLGLDEEEEEPVNMTVAATAGAAGLLLMGPMAGAIVAAGTIAYSKDSDRLKRYAQNTLTSFPIPQSLAECQEVSSQLGSKAKEVSNKAAAKAADVLADRAKEAVTIGRNLYSAFSGKSIAERDEMIESLQRALAVSSEVAEEERSKLNAAFSCTLKAYDDAAARLKSEEKRWRDQSSHLNSQLAETMQAHAEERERLRHELEVARFAKDHEIERLASLVEDTKRTLAQAEFEKAETIRQSREDSESKSCTICMDRARQVLFLPCRHVACCQQCAAQLQNCPIDRSAIAQKIELIVS